MKKSTRASGQNSGGEERSASELAFARLKKTLVEDKSLPAGFTELLRADLERIFGSYFEYNDKDFLLSAELDNGGGYCVKITLSASRAKRVKVI